MMHLDASSVASLFYDGKTGRYVGKQARKYQTWSIVGYLVAKMMPEDPSHLGMISLEGDKQMKLVFPAYFHKI